jgi:hypothetical protein
MQDIKTGRFVAIPLAERFWARVDKDGPVPAHMQHLGGCWLWIGDRMKSGYGIFLLTRKKKISAQRVAFYLEHGMWPKHLACHYCDNPQCVRPSHIFDGTASDNAQDSIAKGRNRNGSEKIRGERHYGHVLTSEQVLEIRSRRTSGEMLKQIAASYGVCYQTIQKVVSNKSWRLQ